MITDNGFMKQDDFEELTRDAEYVEIKCPVCKEMTRMELIPPNLWECLECGEIFSS